LKAFGDQVGNGGKAVVCRRNSGQIASSLLLDFYESEVLYHLRPSFISGSYLEKARAAISSLRNIDNHRHEFLQSLLTAFVANTRFVKSPLIDTPDSDHIVAAPQGCSIEQAAIQIKPSFPQDKRYTINEEIWNSLDEDHRAGLVLHEIIYFEAIARGHRNSIAVRYYNAHLSGDRFKEMSEEDYAKLISTTNLRTQIWLDLQTKKKWIFLATLNANWHVAKEACSTIALAVLPSKEVMQAAAANLIASPIFDSIAEENNAESWTLDRSPVDGQTAIGLWSSTGIDIFYRNPNTDNANVLCLKQ
jgi:hypothetical protein